MKQEKVAATIIIHGAAEMTDHGREEVARWIEEKARDLTNEGEWFGKTVRMSYRVPQKKK